MKPIIIHNRVELREHLQTLYVIDRYTSDHTIYEEFRSKIYNILRGCYEIAVCRNYPVRVKFTAEDETTYTLPLKMFVINTILWVPFVELHGLGVLSERYILSDPETIPHINEWISEYLIKTLDEYHIASTKKNKALSKVRHYCQMISNDYSLFIGVNFSAHTFMSLYMDHPEIKSMMEAEFEKDAQPAEIEGQLDQLQSRFIKHVASIPENQLGLVLRAGTGIKGKQLREFTIAQGFKPDLEGKTIPMLNQNSTLIGGASTPSALYIESMGSRKSLIMNKKVMGKAGFFGKKLLMAARTLSLSTEITDCGSTHLVAYEVTNKKVLKKLIGKYFQYTRDEDEPLHLLTVNTENLIGKTIYVRSAATCCCGDKVCPVCVGTAAINNADLADGLSGFESEEITKVVNQNVLSTKHLLTTNSEEIKFNQEFYDFFQMVSGEIYLKDDPDFSPENYAIYVNPKDIAKAEEQDENSTYNVFIEEGRFYVRNINDPTVEDILIQTENDKEIFIDSEMFAMLQSSKFVVPMSFLDAGNKIFEVVIMNRELTRPLYDLMALLDKQNKDMDLTIDFIHNQFLKYCIDGGIGASAIACELIINRLIRRADNIYERPDFSVAILDPYVIVTATQSLLKSPSPFVGLSFQNLRSQILSDQFFTHRTSVSYIDPLYAEDVPTDAWYEGRDTNFDDD